MEGREVERAARPFLDADERKQIEFIMVDKTIVSSPRRTEIMS